MYLQTVMLLLRAEVTGPQDGRGYRVTPHELVLFCGMSIGYEDVTVEYIRTGRAPLDETVTFIPD